MNEVALKNSLEKLLGLESYGFEKPKQKLYITALQFLENAALSPDFVEPNGMGFDGEGNLHSHWVNPKTTKELTLVISSDNVNSSYIYKELGKDYSVKKDVKPKELKSFIEWLVV